MKTLSKFFYHIFYIQSRFYQSSQQKVHYQSFFYHASSEDASKHVFIVTENTMFEQDKKANLKSRAR